MRISKQEQRWKMKALRWLVNERGSTMRIALNQFEKDADFRKDALEVGRLMEAKENRNTR